MADPYALSASSAADYGTQGAVVTPDSGVDFTTVAKAVCVTSIAGGTTLRVLPAGNADADFITFTGVAVGYIPPYRIRRVHADTTCTVASVLG
jgi:hypothetical protein